MKSKRKQNKPKILPETIALIREMANENHVWGAERIRGELLKLGIKVCKRTIQKYTPKESHYALEMRQFSSYRRTG